MGADLVPLVENFIIESKTFAASDCAVVEGCAEVGTRQLLRKVVEGSHWILDFGADKANAQKAKNVIQHYGMNRICYVGRPDPTNQQLMMYLTVNGAAPTGALAGEDAICLQPGQGRRGEVRGAAGSSPTNPRSC